MSLFDQEWSWTSERKGFGVVLNDPMDVILQRLSVPYLDEAKSRAMTVLTTALEREVDLVAGYFHPAKENWFPDVDPALEPFGPFVDRDGPFGGFGWVDRALDDRDFVLRWPALLPAARNICVELIEGSPSLALCGGGVCARSVPLTTDSEAHLSALLASSYIDRSDWSPTRPLGPEAVAEDAPLWLRAQAAAERCDANTFRELEDEAYRRYSPAGFRLLSFGLSGLLIYQLKVQQEAEAGGG
jgi:hypothetical protein